MAKNEAMEKNTSNKVKELKKEFQKLAMQIVEEENEEDIINKAIKALYLLKDLKLKNNKNKFGFDNNSSHVYDFINVIIPNEFLCPISKQLMNDPVVLSTGQTYDRRFIQKWLKEGHRTCPQTQQVLSHTVLTPNHLVRELIAQWCKDNDIEYAPPIHNNDDDEFLTDDDRSHLNSLLKRMSSTLSDQKKAAKEIRSLTKRMPSFRSFFEETTEIAIPQLLTPLTTQGNLDDHPDLQEDLITSLLNLSIHDNNKKVVAEHPLVVPLLVESLTRGTIETRTNAAATLFTLSALDSNKHLIGKSGALKPLIDLLEEGDPLAMKDAASAIFNLCLVIENRGRAVQGGAISVMLTKIMDRILVDELLAILAMLSSHQGAVEELSELGAVGGLLGLIRETSSERNKENCIAILYSICVYDRGMLKEVREEERANRTISTLSQNGTQRARRKAKGILDRLNRSINMTHTT